MDNEFVIISGFPNYEINREGTIRRIRDKYILRPKIRSNGYYCINLRRNGKMKNLFIHRLLAIAFIPNPTNKPCVNHIDGDKLNNLLNNLEWCTQKENIVHAYCIRLTNNKGEKHYMAKLTEQNVIEIRRLIKIGMMQKEISSLFDIHQNTISSIHRRKTWKHI